MLPIVGLGCGSVPREQVDAGARADAVVSADAATEVPDAPTTDAAVVVPRCDPSKPFGPPTHVDNVSSPQRDQGAVLVDDLTLIFGSDRAGTGLYMATRPSPTSPFSTPVALTAINATGQATGPALTADAQTMYYTLSSDVAPRAEIYVTTRTSKAAAFPAGNLVKGVNSEQEDLDPYITPDGSALYFDSARNATALHLYVAVRRGDGSFGEPEALTSLNTGFVDSHPVLTQDGLRIYWSSTRPDGGHEGTGTDVWTATRPSTAGTFGTPTRVSELSSAANESLSWIAPDNCTAYLQSDRTGTLGAQDIFEAVRPK